tara:strand:+ start:122 stop:274 length:153 start_codon:yes stop_codon:yes gene_type:complete
MLMVITKAMELMFRGITDLLRTPQEVIIGMKEVTQTLTPASKVQETLVDL